MRRVSSSWLKATVVALLVVALDQISKATARAELVRGETVAVLPGLDLTKSSNDGVAFGLLGGGQAAVVIFTVVAVAVLLFYFGRHSKRSLLWLPTGLLLGGAIGNLIDRLTYDSVTDFIKLPLWPVFNVADIAITVGVIILVILIERARKDASTS